VSEGVADNRNVQFLNLLLGTEFYSDSISCMQKRYTLSQEDFGNRDMQ